MKQLPRPITGKNLFAMILIGLGCLLFINLTSCLYTKKAAVRNFGCKTDSISVDSNTTHTVDTFYKPFFLPPDTVTVQSPCEEIAKMNPGETKSKKGNRTTSTYGKDTAGKSFFICLADEYKDSMEWYKEQWKTTVYTTEYRHQPVNSKWYNDPEKVIILSLAIVLFLLLSIMYFSRK